MKNPILSILTKRGPLVLAALLAALFAVPVAFAQTATPAPVAGVPTLAVNGDVMATQMMTGANIIVGAIGVVIFLLIGMKLGGVIIRAISSAIDGLRI